MSKFSVRVNRGYGEYTVGLASAINATLDENYSGYGPSGSKNTDDKISALQAALGNLIAYLVEEGNIPLEQIDNILGYESRLDGKIIPEDS